MILYIIILFTTQHALYRCSLMMTDSGTSVGIPVYNNIMTTASVQYAHGKLLCRNDLFYKSSENSIELSLS